MERTSLDTSPKARGIGAPKFAALSYVVGILCSTASTYVLFIVFSLRSEPESLGLFALWSGAVAIILQFIDGVSAQRIAQGHAELSVLCGKRPGSVDYLNRGRFVVVVAAGMVVFVFAYLFDSALATGAATMLVGQGAYALCVSTRVFESSKSLLALQLFNCLVYCIAAAAAIIMPIGSGAGTLLTLSGLASLFAALPSLIRDFIDRAGMDLSAREEARLLYLSHSWRHLGSLTAYQAVNACGTAVDTLLTAVGGLRTAAEYQVIKRPMLALSSLNVAVGQHALNKYARGSTAGWQKSLIVLSPVLVAWPVLGLVGLVLVRWITPDDYDVSFLGGGLLAFSFAVGAFLQITGAIVLVRKKTTALFVAALGRIVVLILIAVIATPELGVVGIGIAIVVANLMLLSAHIAVLVHNDKVRDSEELVVSR